MGRHGENIRKRADGRWEARYIQYYSPEGKAVYRYIYGKSYLEAKEKRKQAMNDTVSIMKGAVSRKLLFCELTEEWLVAKKGQIKESTYAHYTNIIKKHLLPELGNIYVAALTEKTLEHFLQGKLTCGKLDGKGGLSSKTVSDIRSLLKQIVEYARKSGYLSLNHLQLSIPSGRNPQIQVFNKWELERLERLLFSEPTPLYFGISIALYCGLRIGEVCALQWKDFHFKEGTVTINKTLIRISDTSPDAKTKTKLLIEKPKTECSNRTIPLPDFLLSYYRAGQCSDETYFLTGTTSFMEPRVCLENYKRVLKKAGIPKHSFHTLRHTFATRCVEQNFDIKSLSEIMGHSNISITMQRYVHPSMEQKRAQMNRLYANANRGQTSGQEFAEYL